MSTSSYIRNPTMMYHVKCVYILGRKAYNNTRLSYAKSPEEAVKETLDVHLWANHPTFMCGVTGLKLV